MAKVQQEMLHPKSHYMSLEHAGHKWGGFWDGLHHFVKKTPTGYFDAAVSESDLTDGSWEFMCERGFTRSKEKAK